MGTLSEGRPTYERLEMLLVKMINETISNSLIYAVMFETKGLK